MKRAVTLGVATTIFATLAGAEGPGALAQDAATEASETTVSAAAPVEGAVADPATEAQTDESDIVFVSEPVVQPLDPEQVAADAAANATPAQAASLRELVASMDTSGELSRDMHCLAGAIYFESKGEPLAGQLAVGRVIVNRTESSRWPDSYCGVVLQRSQFSFVRGGAIPAINTSSKAWRDAKAIARIAHQDLWDSPAKGATFFHAVYVNPRWRLTRVAQVNNHIFYR